MPRPRLHRSDNDIAQDKLSTTPLTRPPVCWTLFAHRMSAPLLHIFPLFLRDKLRSNMDLVRLVDPYVLISARDRYGAEAPAGYAFVQRWRWKYRG